MMKDQNHKEEKSTKSIREKNHARYARDLLSEMTNVPNE